MKKENNPIPIGDSVLRNCSRDPPDSWYNLRNQLLCITGKGGKIR